MSASKTTRAGEQIWAKMPKMNAEFFCLTYGALVVQLVNDLEDVAAVNDKLEKMGHSIGTRLVDEFLAKSGVTGCRDFTETADVIAKIAFRMFLGVAVDVANWNPEKTACSLLLYDNPLGDFVELPPPYNTELLYSNVLCGVVRGALEMVQMRVECYFVRDMLRGDDVNEIRVELKEMIADEMASEYRRE
ncbi:NO signaling/Golgi transport ligand-binding domain-containing protein [Pelagophyceae sp. CCMP2097]|nr:NO signaling/Golgi transport ligand-binding domain-containing protein [Pelagophyceae sp. CCMP2097]